MSTHTISYKREGKAEMQSTLPICSCGWHGRKEYAYNDYCWTNVKEQADDHIRAEHQKDRKAP